MTHWKRPWCWERLMAGEGDHTGWDGWMASLTQWTWVWVDSGSWWWTGRPGVLWFMGSQRVRHDWVTELNWTETAIRTRPYSVTVQHDKVFSLLMGQPWTGIQMDGKPFILSIRGWPPSITWLCHPLLSHLTRASNQPGRAQGEHEGAPPGSSLGQQKVGVHVYSYASDWNSVAWLYLTCQQQRSVV